MEEDNSEEPEPEKKELTETDKFILENVDILTSDDYTEAEKTAFSMIAMTMSMNEHKTTPAFLESSQKWTEEQRIILEHLVFEGAVIKEYDIYQDGLSGCYLLCDFDNYKIEINIEDVHTLEELLERKCIEIGVFHKDLPNSHLDSNEEDLDYPLNLGFVETMEEAKKIVGYLERSDNSNLGRENFDSAMKILFRLKSGFHGQKYKEERTSDELSDIAIKSRTQDTRG